MALSNTERCKRYRKRHPDRVREYKRKYYKIHPERKKREARRDYLRHKEAYLRRAKKAYNRNPEKYKEKVLKWKKKNHYWQIQDAKRKSLKKELGGSFTLEQWDNKKKQYNYCCAICGRDEKTLLNETGIGLTVDHIIPLNKWKKYVKKYPLSYKCGDIENIQPLCINCNSRKHDKILGLN